MHTLRCAGIGRHAHVLRCTVVVTTVLSSFSWPNMSQLGMSAYGEAMQAACCNLQDYVVELCAATVRDSFDHTAGSMHVQRLPVRSVVCTAEDQVFCNISHLYSSLLPLVLS